MPPPLVKQSSSTSSIKKRLPEELNNDITVVKDDSSGTVGEFKRLEEIFEAYILALHLRRGNVVDKVLRGRAAADELSVNELYNVMSRLASQRM
jgi:hypothetical protein